jgi:PKD repeat protein
LVFLIIFLNLLSTSKVVASSNPRSVEGYVYIDGIITKPDEVTLLLPDPFGFVIVYTDAKLFEDGRYTITFYNDYPGTIGTFLVVYHNEEYSLSEKIIIQENQDIYETDLHIETNIKPDLPPNEQATNIQPKAIADGPYYKTVNETVYFNGGKSYDEDGSITEYEWDFGDGTRKTGVTQTHTYDEANTYIIILTVTDDKGTTDLDVAYAYITDIPNNPPTQPTLNGIKMGTIYTKYNFTTHSTDSDNDNIKYVIDWGDDTELTYSQFLQNDTSHTVNHSWIYPGIYIVTAYAIDENKVASPPTKQTILIDTIYCGEIGYITDYTGDNIYDLFYSNETKLETPVEQENRYYLIDVDNDRVYDYQYDIITSNLSAYIQPITNNKETSLIDLINPYFPYILFVVGFVLLALSILSAFKPKEKIEKKDSIVNGKKRPEKEKSFYLKEKKKQKPMKTENEIVKSIEESKDIEDIENQIDEILSKKR